MSYKNEIQKISPDKELIFKTKRKMREMKPSKTVYKRPVAVLVLAILLLLSTTITVFASGDLVLSQVNKSAVFDGIEMTVTDVNIKNNGENENGSILLTLKDVDNKNRINESTDIKNFDVRGFVSDGCKLKSYDAATKTATYEMKVFSWPHGGVSYFNKRGKITVNTIVTNKKSKYIDTQLDVLGKLNKNYHADADIVVSSISVDDNGADSSIAYQLLRNDETDIPLKTIDWLRISNIAFTAKNHLNIQIKLTGDMKDYNTVNLVLKRKDGSEANNINQTAPSAVDNHLEYVFEITEEELKDCRLYAEVSEYTDGEAIKGEWETVFHK